jgi:hypothetical protein
VKPYPLTVLAGGINRLRVKGGAAANQLYDLQNGYITNAGSIVPREGTIRTATLDSSTVGLAAANGLFNIFSSSFSTATLPAGYVLNVLSDPNDRSQPVVKIWFAKPFMGFEFVVAEFGNGDIAHFWLQNNGTWTSSTDYTSASIVLPPVPNGIAYQGVRDFPPNPDWSADTTIDLGNIVEPTTPTGFAYKAVGVGTAAGSGTAAVTPQLLLHMDTVGSAVFTDSSPSALTIINGTGFGQNPVSQSATNPKFAPGCGVFSTTNAVLTAPIVPGGPIDIQNDFTIDGWFNVPLTTATGTGSEQLLFSTLTSTTDQQYLQMYILGTGQLIVQSVSQSNTGVDVSPFTTLNAVTTNTWHHFAAVRAHSSLTSSNFFCFLDGQLIGASAVVPANNGAFGILGTGFHLGGSGISWTQNTYLRGSLDEVRITNGVALWTTGFTPPTAPAIIAQAHTGAVEPVWPTVAGATLQEFGDFDVSSTDAGTTQATSNSISTASPLGSNITDRYGDSSTIANAGIFAATSTLSTLTLASTKITTWAPGTLYAPGAVVQPSTGQGAFINAIPNGDFEGGSAAGGWTFNDPLGGPTEWAFSNTLPYQGTECLSVPGGAGMGAQGAFATMTSFGLITPGQSVTATAYLDPNNSGANLTLWLQLNWYDITDTIISSSGYQQNEQEGGGYRKVSVTGVAPSAAAHVRVSIGAGSGTNSRNAGFADLVSWNLETAAPITNFLFEAVQLTAASSGTTEPLWPTTLDAEIIDGGVTWEAIGTSIITWEAIPLMQSGLTAPTFPTGIGNTVFDPSTFTDQNGVIIQTSMSWMAVDRSVSDIKDPNTKAVTIGASHVFAGDNDIVDYSAAVNPLDWTSTNNAGYLPTGLNNYGDNPVTALALYRGNLIVFNAGGYQMWQIDPDPQNMAFLDAQAVGSIYPRGAQSVANDLLFLTEIGVRNLGTIGATANMAIGNTGQQVDPLVLAQIKAATYDPFSTYYPGRGQYWLIWGPQVFVLTINGLSGTKSWARYIFPDIITDATLNGGFLYLRTAGNLVWQLNSDTLADDYQAGVGSNPATGIAFNGVVQWPYLDMGALGLNKMMVGVDLVGEGDCYIQLAYNQSDKSTFNDNANFATSTGVTAPYFVTVDDTVPGEPLPIPINAPSYSLILTFPGSVTSANAWSWEAANLYISPGGGAGATG